MIRKSGHRFCEKIMLKKKDGAKLRVPRDAVFALAVRH